MKVLVAEDSAVMRCLLISNLQEWNYETVEAENGEQAWQKFLADDFSLVLTDWIMPEVDGLELIRRIRAEPRSRYCYVILLTAKTEKEDLITAMEAGADDFLVKPCDREELRVRLREGERIIRLEQTLSQQNLRLRETQAALVESEKLAGLGQLAAGMAHEINNPIAFVTNNLAVLRRELASVWELLEKYQQTLPVVEQASPVLGAELRALQDECDLDWLREHLPQLLQSSTNGLSRVRDIIKNLRDFARLDQTGQDALDLAKATRSTITMLRHLIDEKHLQIKTNFESVPHVVCRPDKIQQVLYNALLNAIQASEDGSSLEICLRHRADIVQIEVVDQGEGMDQATLNRVFEPFFTTKPVGTGTGLGMAISYGIIRDHGGSITIESELHQGTRVQVDLPLTSVPSPPPQCVAGD